MKETIPTQASAASVMKLAYSPEEAAEVIGAGRSTLYEVLASGDLRSRKLGRRTLILHDDLMAWLASLPVRETEAA